MIKNANNMSILQTLDIQLCQDNEENGGGTYGNKEYGKKDRQHSRNIRWKRKKDG
jgi:hypothetical protein